MAVKLGIVAFLEAQPGKADELADFLRSGREIAAGEEGTVTWYAFRVDDATYGIFDTFESDADREAHLNGEIPKALARVGPDLLASDPDIRPVEILAVK
jgi:quinol monooxygenase YgiN